MQLNNIYQKEIFVNMLDILVDILEEMIIKKSDKKMIPAMHHTVSTIDQYICLIYYNIMLVLFFNQNINILSQICTYLS